MGEKKNDIEVHQTVSDAIARIKELRTKGIDDTDIHVFSDNQEDAELFTYETEVTYTSTEGTVAEKISSVFSDEDAEEKALDRFIELSDKEKEQYANELKNGNILLYVGAAMEENVRHSPLDYDKDDGTLTEVNKDDDHDGTIITGGSTQNHASKQKAKPTPDYTAGREKDRK